MLNIKLESTLLDALIKENKELRDALDNEQRRTIFYPDWNESQPTAIEAREVFKIASLRASEKRQQIEVLLTTENGYFQAYYLSKELINGNRFDSEQYLSRLHENFIRTLIDNIHKKA